jgi:hypothetical protein
MLHTPFEHLIHALLGTTALRTPAVRRQKEVLFCDIECYRDLFYVAFKRLSDGKRAGFEHSHRQELDRERVRRLMRNNTIVTFNGMTYDVPMIYLALTGATNEELKQASDRIIKGGLKWWDVERELGVQIPRVLDHIDLIEPNPAVMQGLKILNGRLHGYRLQDLPYPEDVDLTDEQMDDVIDYCKISDLDATHNLYDALQEPLALRVALGEQYGMDFRSKSDAQMGEAIIKKRIEKLTGKRPQKAEIKPGTSFRYRIPDWMEFESDQMREIVDTIRKTDFIIKKDGKVDFPKAFEKFKIKIGSSIYKMGIGGLHSTEANRSAHSTNQHVLVDADVASQYPRIIMKLGLYPKALGRDFLSVYNGLIQDRIVAKKAGDKVKDKAGKIALNGAYGKLGSRYSVLYAPHLLISVTLTGQLSLLMLIEKAESMGIPVISGNTDGVVFKCPREFYEGIGTEKPDKDRLLGGKLKEITDWWERVTCFDLEFAEYRSIYNQSVNSYIAIKSDGKVKRKGPIGNPWSNRPEENDVRSQMMKNPQMTICSDAVLEHILTGKPIEDSIRESSDIRGFVTVINAAGGATWRDGYLGKVVRYYWSTDGDPIIKVKPHPSTGNRPKVPKTDGCRPIMTLPNDFPEDVDYARYVEEARKILDEIGFGKNSDFGDLLGAT